MALFELNQKYENAADGWKPPTFKDCAAADISLAFFNGGEHAQRRTVDGKECLIVLEESTLKEHSSNREAGAKQNFDTGLYAAYSILYIRAEDYQNVCGGVSRRKRQGGRQRWRVSVKASLAALPFGLTI